MSRLGVSPEGVVDMARRMADTPGVIFEGMFTHFARADELEPGPTDEQEVVFQQVLEQLEDVGLRPPLVHAANSATTLTRPNDHFDMVRAGIAIYGLHPSHECSVPEEFQPALTWKTQLSQVKLLPPGRGLSYGHIYTTSRNELIGTLPVGYADGFRRTTGNQALVGGRRVPVVGRVCMDQCLVQLDAVPDARPGDEVVLIGSQGEESISAEEVADRWGTINYEVTCGIGARVPRLYSGEISTG
jgi:alanine racemase